MIFQDRVNDYRPYLCDNPTLVSLSVVLAVNFIPCYCFSSRGYHTRVCPCHVLIKSMSFVNVIVKPDCVNYVPKVLEKFK